MTHGRMRKGLGGEQAFLYEGKRESGDLWIFSWRNGDGNIGGVRAEDLLGAKKKLWKILEALGHEAVMKDLKRGKKYDYVRFRQG